MKGIAYQAKNRVENIKDVSNGEQSRELKSGKDILIFNLFTYSNIFHLNGRNALNLFCFDDSVSIQIVKVFVYIFMYML